MKQNGESDQIPSAQDVELELCPQCMANNRPNTHFCHKCGAPLSSYAATAPFERLFAEGHAYRRATEQPQSLIVVLGMWLIFGVFGVVGIWFAIHSWLKGEVFFAFLGLPITILSVMLVGKTHINYLNRRSRHRQGAR